MHRDPDDTYRLFLEEDPPRFTSRIDDPWGKAPDIAEHNKRAYKTIVRTLKGLQRSLADGEKPQSQGVLLLGEAGMGKTHLLMRVARELGATNHILFIRRPNNEDAVVQHIWFNIVDSLRRPSPNDTRGRSQLDDLLAHVFTRVIIPVLKDNLGTGETQRQRERWIAKLEADPLGLFDFLGTGQQRTKNLDWIRKRTLEYLARHYPEADLDISRALISYCFYAKEDDKRAVLSWLQGQQIDAGRATALGLTESWLTATEDNEASFRQQKEEIALRAIRTIGVLSLQYEPLILAFDQLEGLREEQTLTRRWGDVVREMFTMVPNMVVLTCIFPSLWESWFQENLDDAVRHRIGETTRTLEAPTESVAQAILRKQLAEAAVECELPTDIYPFEEADVPAILAGHPTPRLFIQRAKSIFFDWLDGEEIPALTPADASNESVNLSDETGEPESQIAPAQDVPNPIDGHLTCLLREFEEKHFAEYGQMLPTEEDVFGRIDSLIKAAIKHSSIANTNSLRLRSGKKLLPSNVGFESDAGILAFLITYSIGAPLTSRLKNLVTLVEGSSPTPDLVFLRDRRCQPPAEKGRECINKLDERCASIVDMDRKEYALLNALYDTKVAVEEQEVVVEDHTVSVDELFEFLRKGSLGASRTFRAAVDRSGWFAEVVGAVRSEGELATSDVFEEMIEATRRELQRLEDPAQRPRYPIYGRASCGSDDGAFTANYRDAHDRVRQDAKLRGRLKNGALIRAGDMFLQGRLRLSTNNQIEVSVSADELSDQQVDVDDVRRVTAAGIDYVMDSRPIVENLLDYLTRNRHLGNRLLKSMLLDDEPTLYNTPIEAGAFSDLNESQQRAVQKALGQHVTFLWGPPGTGKTKTLASIAAALLQSGRRVMLISLSNAAVDALLAVTVHRLKESGTETTIARLGNAPSEHCGGYSKKDFGKPSFQSPKAGAKWPEHVRRAKLVVANYAILTYPQTPYLGTFDYVLVDEASMANVPHLAAASLVGSQGMVITGDPHQLPPIAKESNGEPNEWYEQNVFVKANIFDVSEPRVAFLDTQYRMQTEIGNLVSDIFYLGQLKSAAEAVPEIPGFERRIRFIDRPNDGVKVDDEKSRRNDDHAAVIADEVGTMLQAGFEASEIGIVAPYNAQVANIYRHLGRRKIYGIQVSTVHRYQGQERRAIIFDITDSDVSPTPLTASQNLLNVAISRARELLVIVGNKDYLTSERYFDDEQRTMFAEIIGHAEVVGKQVVR